MDLRAASRQLDTPCILALLTAIERTYWRNRYFFVGPKHAWAMPAANGDFIDNARGCLTQRDAFPAPSIRSFHLQPDSAGER